MVEPAEIDPEIATEYAEFVEPTGEAVETVHIEADIGELPIADGTSEVVEGVGEVEIEFTPEFVEAGGEEVVSPEAIEADALQILLNISKHNHLIFVGQIII